MEGVIKFLKNKKLFISTAIFLSGCAANNSEVQLSAPDVTMPVPVTVSDVRLEYPQVQMMGLVLGSNNDYRYDKLLAVEPQLDIVLQKVIQAKLIDSASGQKITTHDSQVKVITVKIKSLELIRKTVSSLPDYLSCKLESIIDSHYYFDTLPVSSNYVSRDSLPFLNTGTTNLLQGCIEQHANDIVKELHHEQWLKFG